MPCGKIEDKGHENHLCGYCAVDHDKCGNCGWVWGNDGCNFREKVKP